MILCKSARSITSASFISNHYYIRSYNGKFLSRTPHDPNDPNDLDDLLSNDEDEDMDQENIDDFEDSSGEADDPASAHLTNQSGLSFPRDMNIADPYNEYYLDNDIDEEASQQPIEPGPSHHKGLGDQMLGM